MTSYRELEDSLELNIQIQKLNMTIIHCNDCNAIKLCDLHNIQKAILQRKLKETKGN